MSRTVQCRDRRNKKLYGIAVLYVLFPLLSSSIHAQLSVINPKHLEMPAERANVILSTACSVVAEEFHQRDNSSLRFQTVLVLGDSPEHYQVDEQKGIYTLYLRQWDERKFATLAMRFCVQRLATSVREDHLVQEILRRANQIGPVSVEALRGRSQPLSVSPAKDTCYSAARDQRCPENQPPH